MFKICFDIWPYIINFFSTAGCVFIMDEFIFKFEGWRIWSFYKSENCLLNWKKCSSLDHILTPFLYSHIHSVVMYGVVPHWISTNLMGTKLGKFSISKSLRELRSERKSPTAKKLFFSSSNSLSPIFPVYCVDHLQILFFYSPQLAHIMGIEFNYFIFPLINEKNASRWKFMKLLLVFFLPWEDFFFAYIQMTFAFFIK